MLCRLWSIERTARNWAESSRQQLKLRMHRPRVQLRSKWVKMQQWQQQYVESNRAGEGKQQWNSTVNERINSKLHILLRHLAIFVQLHFYLTEFAWQGIIWKHSKHELPLLAVKHPQIVRGDLLCMVQKSRKACLLYLPPVSWKDIFLHYSY